MQKWSAKVVGKGRQLGNTEVEKLDLKSLTCEQALFHVAKIMTKVKDEGRHYELEINWITEANGYIHEVVSKEKVDKAEADAAKAIEDEDED